MIIDYEDDGVIRWERNGEKKHADLIELIEAYEDNRKHGHWIDEGLVDGNQNRYCRCSECGRGDTQAISQRVPYCWWCGAKMDK